MSETTSYWPSRELGAMGHHGSWIIPPGARLLPYAFGFQAVSKPVPDAMQHHIEVGTGNPQDVTDVLSGEFLNLTQDKGQRLAGGSGVEASEDLSFDLDLAP